MKYIDAVRDHLPESMRYPRSREWWTRDRTTLCAQKEPDWPELNFKLSDFASPGEIATAIAGVEQTWRDMGRRVKELNRVAPKVRTIEAMRGMSKDEDKAVREAQQAAYDRRRVREIADYLCAGTIDSCFRYHRGLIEGEAGRLIVEFEERHLAAHRAACAAFKANWKPAPVDDVAWEAELRQRGRCMARETVEQQLSPQERERRMSGINGQFYISDLIIKRTDELMATTEGGRFVEAARELAACRCDACRRCHPDKDCISYDRVRKLLEEDVCL